MMKFCTRDALVLILCLFSSIGNSVWASPLEMADSSRFFIELEGQKVFQALNDAAVPGNTGTRFSMMDVTDSSFFGYRIEPVFQISPRHQIRGVFAPLQVDGTGRLSRPVTFEGASFSEATEAEGFYQFNSYRLTYRYAFVPGKGTWSVFGGFTGKIRDAKIRLKQGGLVREKSNVGFVPLLYGAVAYHMGGGWSAELEVDALAAPQGRAEDVRVGLRKSFYPGLSALVGYRLLEGGADNDEVYTFSLFHYAVASLAYGF